MINLAPLLKQKLAFSAGLLILTFFLFCSHTTDIYAQNKNKPPSEKDSLQDLDKNPYKTKDYKQVCDAFLFAKKQDFEAAKKIINKIDRSKSRSIRYKLDPSSAYEIYRAIYGLTKGLVLKWEGEPEEAQKHIANAITEFNSIPFSNMRRQEVNSYGFGKVLNEAMTLQVDEEVNEEVVVVEEKIEEVEETETTGTDNNHRKVRTSGDPTTNKDTGNPTPLTTPPPPPSTSRPLTPEELAKQLRDAESLAIKNAIDAMNAKMGKVENSIKEALMRADLDDQSDNVDVTNCGDDMSPIDMRITFDYVEGGFAGDAVIPGLSVSSPALNSTIKVVAKTLNEFVGPDYGAPADDIKAHIIGQTDNSPFETMAMVDGANWYIIPINDDMDLVIERSDGTQKRFRKDGLIMDQKELAAVRAALAKQKLDQQSAILDKMDITTDYLINQETGKVRVQVTVKDAFMIYLDDLKEQSLGELFLDSAEFSCLCKECGDCMPKCDEFK